MSRQNRFWSQLLLVISLPTLFGCGGGTVNAPPPVTLSVTSLGLNPSSVTGGQRSTGTVTLNGPAPSGGAAVTLSSGNAAAQVPGAVNIPAGSATATFQATSAAVNAVTPVTITATLNGTATGALTINPVSVATIGFNPNSVTGGQSTSGTVTLNGPAPAGGVTVQLSSGNPAGVSFPSSVNIPAGNNSKTFQTTTPSVGVVTVVALTATLNGSVVGKLYLDPVSSTVVSLMLGTNMFQTFEAWRGTLTGPDLQDPNGVMVPLPQATINQAIADMDDLGLNGFRITLFGSDFIPASFNPPVYNFTKIDSSVQAIVIPLKKLVEARHELFSTYISLAADSTTFQKLTNNDQAVYQQFVQQFRAFALAPQNFGFEPTYWVVVNDDVVERSIRTTQRLVAASIHDPQRLPDGSVGLGQVPIDIPGDPHHLGVTPVPARYAADFRRGGFQSVCPGQVADQIPARVLEGDPNCVVIVGMERVDADLLRVRGADLAQSDIEQ